MTWKIEVAALAITAASVGGYLYKADPFAAQQVTYHETFTEDDYHAFDRNFMVGDTPCEVGLKESKVCLPALKSDVRVIIGEKLPSDIPALSASMRELLALDSKVTELKTVRFGQTLVLIEPNTEIVRDVLRLSAESYASSRLPALRPVAVASAAN